MKLTLLGVRGSTPAPGAAFVRYGGHTSCVAVTAAADDRATLVLDAGTGVRQLGDVTGGDPFDGVLALTHLHWDHLQGLPFAPVLDHPGARVRVWVPGTDAAGAAALVGRSMSPPHFPVGPEGLLGAWSWCGTGDGGTGGFAVRSAAVEHKGGTTVGYRVDEAGRSFAYLPDHSPAAGVGPELLELLAGVDVLLHDGQFLAGEEPIARAYGHATVPDAVELARRAGAGRLVLVHHAPGRDDDALDRLAADVARTEGLDVSLGREGQTLEL